MVEEEKYQPTDNLCKHFSSISEISILYSSTEPEHSSEQWQLELKLGRSTSGDKTTNNDSLCEPFPTMAYS